MLSGGIDLGGTKIQAVVVDASHAVLGQARSPTPVSYTHLTLPTICSV